MQRSAILILLSALTAAAQPPQPQIPRTADGKPDLSGIWMSAGGLSDRPGGRAAGPAAPKPDPPPYSEEAQARIAKIRADQNRADPMALCLLVGVPRIMSMPMPMQIIQTPSQITTLHEAFHAFRIIPTDGRSHPADLDDTYMGDSVGRWEGDTLVIDVTGFNDVTWLGMGGATIHTDKLRVTERFTMTDRDTIAYEATMVDPGVFTKPFSGRLRLTRRPTERIREYECIENNLDADRLYPKK